jgi:hypothetical protein
MKREGFSSSNGIPKDSSEDGGLHGWCLQNSGCDKATIKCFKYSLLIDD